MPRFCYAVMAHRDAPGALRLLRRIRALSPDSHVLLRCDDPRYVSAAQVAEAGGTRLVSRVQARWGDYSLVEMALETLTVSRALPDVDHVVLLSGQDYPVRDLRDWEEEFRGVGADALLDPLAEQPDDHDLRWRVVTPPGVMRPARSVLRRAALRAGMLDAHRISVHEQPGDPRLWVGARLPSPAPVRPVKAGLWAVLNDRAVESVLTQEHDRPELRRYFSGVRTPDEWFVPSLLANDPDLRLAYGRTTSKRFAPTASRPDWLDEGLLTALTAQAAAPFVRKVSDDVDPAVLALADRLADRTPAQVHADVTVPAETLPDWVRHTRATFVPTSPPMGWSLDE